jgi:hypothetical protein
LITESSEHEPDRGETQECQGIAAEIFKVLGQSPASVEPGEGAFDNPTLWENLEAFGVIRPFGDFDFEVRKRFGQSLLKDRPLISAIGEELLQKRIHAEQGRENEHASIADLNIGRMHDRMKQEP